MDKLPKPATGFSLQTEITWFGKDQIPSSLIKQIERNVPSNNPPPPSSTTHPHLSLPYSGNTDPVLSVIPNKPLKGQKGRAGIWTVTREEMGTLDSTSDFCLSS